MPSLRSYIIVVSLLLFAAAATPASADALSRFPGGFRSSTGSYLRVFPTIRADKYELQISSGNRVLGSALIHVIERGPRYVRFHYKWQGHIIHGQYNLGGGDGVRVWDGTGWEAYWERNYYHN